MKNKITFSIIWLLVISLCFMLEGKRLLKPKVTNIAFDLREFHLAPFFVETPKNLVFLFSNTGVNPLVIEYIETSCGCTHASWPEYPIAPGQSDSICITYLAKYPGTFIQTIKVFCNSDTGVEELTIEGEVVYGGVLLNSN